MMQPYETQNWQNDKRVIEVFAQLLTNFAKHKYSNDWYTVSIVTSSTVAIFSVIQLLQEANLVTGRNFEVRTLIISA